MAVATAPPSPERFFETLQAYQRTAALRAAIELDLFTAISKGAHDVRSIAAACHASERGIRMLCDYMAIIGFVDKKAGTYELAPDAQMFLTKGSPAYLGGIVEFIASSEISSNFDRLADTVRRGTVPETSNTVSTENPVWEKFARAMVPMMFPTAQEIANILEIPSGGRMRVLDIAAGHGIFGITLAQRNSNLEVVAVDWKNVVKVASENAAKMGVGAQHKTVAGDAFTVNWGTDYDIALITNFLHHFDAKTNVTFLRKVADSMNPGGRVVVLEFVPFDDRINPPMAASFVMNMLAGTPSGDAYTYAELSDMLIDAGWKDPKEHRLQGPETVIVANKH
jgi:2-polyprenyl-3-methyl-5-hydroxy-6-metoxy-1,4-benzoquinol methylase